MGGLSSNPVPTCRSAMHGAPRRFGLHSPSVMPRACPQQSGQAGSVRDRASQYNRDAVGRNLSSGHKNRKHGGGSAKLTKTATIGGDMLAVEGTDTEEVAKLIVTATKSVGGHEACEAAHTSCLSLDPAMVPFRLIVQPHIGPVCNRLAELGGDHLRGKRHGHCSTRSGFSRLWTWQTLPPPGTVLRPVSGMRHRC